MEASPVKWLQPNQPKKSEEKSSQRRFLPLDFACLLIYLKRLPELEDIQVTKTTPGRPFFTLKSKDGPLDRRRARALRQHEQLSVPGLEVQDAPPPALVSAADLHRGHEL